MIPLGQALGDRLVVLRGAAFSAAASRAAAVLLTFGAYRLAPAEVGPQYLLFFSTVLFVALFLGRGPGFLATGTSTAFLAYSVLQLRPQFGPNPFPSRGSLFVSAFALVGVVTSEVAGFYGRTRLRNVGLRRLGAPLEKSRPSPRGADEGLRANEARLRVFVEDAPVPVAMFDRSMRYLAVSNRFAQNYKLNAENLIGRSHYEVFPDIPDRWKEIHRRCIAGAVEGSEEDPFPRHDGEVEWIRWELRPWRDGEGGIGGVILFSENVTERKVATQKLAADREHLAVTLRSIGDGVIATDEKGRIQVMNSVAETFTGCKVDEVMGLPLREVFLITSEEDGQPAQNPVDRVLRDGMKVGFSNHTVLRSRDGIARPIATSAAPICDPNGILKGAVLVFRDQSEVRHAERAQKESEALYRTIFEEAAVGLALIEISTGRYLEVNPRLCEILGHSSAELLATTWSRITHPDDLNGSYKALKRMRVGGEPYRREKRYLRKDGSVAWVSLTVSLVGTSAGESGTYLSIVEDITEQKVAEEAIRSKRALEDQLARVGESVPGVICSLRLTLDRRVSMPFSSPGAEDLFGVSREDLARDLSGFVANLHPDDAAGLKARMKESARTLSRWHEEYRYLHPKKGLVWLEGWSMPRPEPDGSVVWHGYMKDVTDRRSAAEALSESEVRFRALFQQAAVGMAHVDAAAGRFLSVNDRLCTLVGYSREELLARGWKDITHPEDLDPAILASPMTALSGPFSRGKRYVRKDGTPVWVEVTVAPMSTAGGKGVTHVLVVQDVEARKRAERELQENEVKFRAILESSTDMILVLDEDMRVVFLSPSVTDQLGWPAEEVMGKGVAELVLADERAESWRSFHELVARPGGSARSVRRHLHKNGSSRLVEVSAKNFLDDPAVKGIVVNLRDITSQRELEEKFRQAQKLESIGRLAGGVAHDFNNLLTVILSCADSLNESALAGLPANTEEIQEIRGAGIRASELTRQLLAFARKQVIAPVPVDLCAVLNSSEKLLRRVLGEDIELLVKPCSELWLTRCDPGQIEQVVMNLAVNARDAMPKGGTLTLETKNVRVGVEEVALHPEQEAGDFVGLTVTDTGLGMTDEVKAHLFEPFFTTKDTGRGTGLGLATVYGIVNQSGGRIHVTSELGLGTRFEILLPRTLEGLLPVTRTAPQTTRGTESILVVEDEPHVRDITVRALRLAGYDVYAAESPQRALELPADVLHRVRLLVTDVVMPGLDGPALADELRRRHPDLRVLFVSGYTHDGPVALCTEACTEFLEKPFTTPALLARVRALLDSNGLPSVRANAAS